MITGGHQPHVKNVVRNRNLMTKWSKPDKVLFIDHDNFPPPFTPARLEQCHQLGADIAGGVYPFFQEDNKDKSQGRIGFCAFFTQGGKYYHASLDRAGTIGEFNADVMGRRIWVEATCMGCTLIRREVLDDVRFTVPFDSEWTDDTRFCYDASERGYGCMSDFGLFVRHWGFDLDMVGRSGRRVIFKMELQPRLVARRSKMNSDGVYPT
jgi:GT2 family glycosyltransferase